MTRFMPLSRSRLVLASALVAATLVALLPDAPAFRSAAAAMPVVLAQDAAKSVADTAREASEAARQTAKEAADAARAAAADAREAAEEARRNRRGITIKGDFGDRQYDSFDQFLDRDPALAGMVLGIVFIVFLTPILIIALIIWYKMRKNRMQNETMLRLAEKGIVPTADALQAAGINRLDAVFPVAGAQPADQAQVLTKRAAWSDLRKGVLMGTVGLAITFHGLLEDGTAGWFGLVLLFVGIGYIALWFFEDRQAAAFTAGRASASVPVRGPGDTPS